MSLANSVTPTTRTTVSTSFRRVGFAAGINGTYTVKTFIFSQLFVVRVLWPKLTENDYLASDIEKSPVVDPTLHSFPYFPSGQGVSQNIPVHPG